jgi:hypothetical protein
MEAAIKKEMQEGSFKVKAIGFGNLLGADQKRTPVLVVISSGNA